MRIKDVLKIKPITTVIDFESRDKTLIDSYVVLEDTSNYFLRILEGMTGLRDEDQVARRGSLNSNTVNRCHKIRGTYGIGKSYFLLMLKAMIESLEDEAMYLILKEKFSSFPSVVYQLEKLYKGGKKYIVVDINGKNFAQQDFKNVVEDAIHRELVNKLGPDKLNFNSIYNQAKNQLEIWKNSNHDIFNSFIRNLKNEFDYTYEELIEGLINRSSNAQKIFKKTYEKTIGHTYPYSFHSLGEFLNETDEIVKNNCYDGMVIIFDELSSYLTGRGEAGGLNTDLSSIDILAEATMPNQGKQLHLIASEHEDIKGVLEQSVANKDSIDRTAGRFADYDINFDRGSKLIESVISYDKNNFNKLKLDNINSFTSYDKSLDTYKLDKVYPINPHAIDYLIRISENYAQGDRTLFSFVDENLRKFVEQKDVLTNGQLNLLGLNEIFDSFEKAIFGKREEFIKAYNNQLQGCQTDLEESVVKALAVDYAVTISDTGRLRVGVNDENIKHLLSISDQDVERVKAYLKKESNDSSSYIIYNSSLGGYELSPEVAGVNIDEEISKILNKTNPRKELNNLISQRSNVLDIQIDYKLLKESGKFPFDRELEGKFLDDYGLLKDLNIEAEEKNIKKEAKILFYIPQVGSPYSYKEILDLAKEKAKEFTSNQLALAIPKEFSLANDAQMFRRFEALRILSLDEAIMSNSRSADTIRLQTIELRNQIYSKLGVFGRSENFVFLFKDNKIKDNVKSINKLMEDWLINEIYPEFPQVEVADLAKRSGSNQVITKLVVPKIVESVNIDGSKIFEKHIRQTLLPLDLVKLTRQPNNLNKVELQKPGKNEKIRNIFKIFAKPEEEQSLVDKFKTLISPPYGLNEPMFELLFAIFIQTHEEFYLTDSAGRVSINQDSVNRVWEKSKLEKIKDALSYERKEDILYILKVIDDNNGKDGQYLSLDTSMPAESFGLPPNMSIIKSYLGIFKQNLESLEQYLKHLSIKDLRLENIDNLKGAVIGITSADPYRVFNEISDLINNHLSNGIEVKDGIETNHSRYEKLNNLMLNVNWLKANADGLLSLKKKANDLYYKTLNIEEYPSKEDIANLKDKIGDIILDQIAKNWSDDRYQTLINLKDIESKVSEQIGRYNGIYNLYHNRLKVVGDELIDIGEKYEYIPLIKALEKIKFTDLSSLDDIQGEIRSLGLCQKDLSLNSDTLAECDKCKGLEEIQKNIQVVEEQKINTTTKLGRLVSRYVEKIDQLLLVDQVKKEYNRDVDLIEYTEEKDPELASDLAQLIAYIREDWATNSQEIIFVLDKVYLVINDFIKNEDPIIGPEKRQISLNSTIDKIRTDLKLSGYSNIPFDKFKEELIKKLEELEEEYDEISIND